MGHDWKLVADNYSIRLRGEGMDRTRCDEVRARLDDPALWANRKLWEEVAEMLPSYRLSKFQPLMPDWVERELMAGYFLDVEGARAWRDPPDRKAVRQAG
jgi:ATP-dependent Lhr-like helicase